MENEWVNQLKKLEGAQIAQLFDGICSDCHSLLNSRLLSLINEETVKEPSEVGLLSPVCAETSALSSPIDNNQQQHSDHEKTPQSRETVDSLKQEAKLGYVSSPPVVTPWPQICAPAFGSTTTPAFGSTGTAFGVSSSPAFGSGGAFGFTSNPVFGAGSGPAFSTPTTSAFGASSDPAFGATSTPTFGAATSGTPLFSFNSSTAFGQPGAAFGSTRFGSTPSSLGASSSPFGKC